MSVLIDEGLGIVYGVAVLGAVSTNGFVFPAAVRRRAHPLLEGARCHWDHAPPGTEAPPGARLGYLLNVREDPATDCTRADLHYLKGHSRARELLTIARRNPTVRGFSILGKGRKGGTDAEGRTIVAAITRVGSIDLVIRPANTAGLYRAPGKERPTEPGALDLVESFDPRAAVENEADTLARLARAFKGAGVPLRETADDDEARLMADLARHFRRGR